MTRVFHRPMGLIAAAVILTAGMVWSTPASASEPFIAEISLFAGNFAPRSWAFCDGRLLPISQNTELFSLIGTTYGGDGRTTTGLPNLQGRFAMHQGRGPGLTLRRLGQKGGTATVTLQSVHMPNHTHAASAKMNAVSGQGDQDDPEGNVPAADRRETQYSSEAPDVNMAPPVVTEGSAGGGQAHDNMPPYLGINHIIALQGLYPPRS